MSETQRSNFEINFFRNWLLICVIGSVLSGVIGVLGGGGAGYYLGGKLGILFSIPSKMLQSISDFLASVLMGVVTGGIASFIQWLVLRKFLSNAKWWILAGIMGSSIGNAINSVSLSSGIISTSDEARFVSLFCFSLIITTSLIGLFKGFIEWLVLRKDFQNSTKWMSVRVITNIIVVTISLIEFSIRTGPNSTIGNNILTLSVSGLIEGVIVGSITGYLLNDFIQRKSDILLSQIQ